ncbi:hypothetical protein IFM89_013686 [Coptis chinensis]|uniref:Uncharacterized protein n=1 Tax=Coptis chinensis TaxID=261450 RepID=A0A835GWC1_9MAGN|nr:hypothetical protein IFM89_013686 [Coptis chinensis]
MGREAASYYVNFTPLSSSSPFIRKFDQMSPTERNTSQRKRIKYSDDHWINGLHANSKYKRDKSLRDVVDYSDPFSVSNMIGEVDCGLYGSVSKEIEQLCMLRLHMLQPAFSLYPDILNRCPDFTPQSPISGSGQTASNCIVELDDDCVVTCPPAVDDSKLVCISSFEDVLQGHGGRNYNNNEVVILDSDDEDGSFGNIKTRLAFASNVEPLRVEMPQDFQLHYRNDMRVVSETVRSTVLDANQKASWQYQEVVLMKPINENGTMDIEGKDLQEGNVVREEQKTLNNEAETKKDEGLYVGVQDNKLSHENSPQSDSDDGLGDIWREMTLALECSKLYAPLQLSHPNLSSLHRFLGGSSVKAVAVSSLADTTGDTVERNEDEGKDCDHSFILKDDLGYVCRVCGVIQKSIDTIFDYQWGKVSKTTRTYMSESRSTKEREDREASAFSGVNTSHDLAVCDISVHPRHMKQMKAHQLEGFNFLVRNLVSGDPGGCILAHAPGSGKTFMIISFIQSFLAKYPHARPLVVLPKGILATWKKEFSIWQVEDFPLYDFYTSKAESREEQLIILKQWVEHKGILFLGYKQFANIVSKSDINSSAAACHDILLQVPTILICDEGHTPRNEDTDVLNSLAKVQTPRKVVLSGTLFQNHVKEVFNILNLVRPKFLKSDTSKSIKRRVMSRVNISGGRRQVKAGADTLFYEMVEETLRNDDNLKRKVTVIQDLREMTSNVLHYYKGDFLDELPGLVDFTVLLNLSLRQRRIIEGLKKVEKFKRTAIGTAVYLHPLLKEFSEGAAIGDKGCKINEERLDKLLNSIDLRDGVKAKFFLNILGLCESSGEKLLVFSQYLLPLKFLERLVVHTKGWRVGKEIFMISGDSSPEEREESMERFNSSADAKIFFGSIKACGEGISLVGASRVLIMDVHLNPSVTRQAIGRTFRPGQVRKVYTYRLVASASPEEENHNTSFRKELISKMWFEWSEFSGHTNFDMETVNLCDSGDEFWQSPSLREDVKDVYKRLAKTLPIECVMDG